MAQTFITPNLHVILIHYPLGVFVLGAIVEIFGFLWPNSTVRQAVRWMILLGVLLMLPAVMSGIYALYDVSNNSTLSARQVHQLTMHVWLECAAAILAVLMIVIGLGASDGWRNRLHLPVVLVLLCILGLLTSGTWFAGETVYRSGTAVQMSDNNSTADQTRIGKFYYFVGDPLQIHMILVGGLVAFTAVGLGLSIRRITLMSAMDDESLLLAHESHPTTGRAGTNEPADSFLPDIESLPPEPRIASTRYWLLAMVFALLTAGAGYWFWGHDNGENFRFDNFWHNTMTAGAPGQDHLTLDRTSAHVWVGLSIIAMTLILAVVVHFARPSKLLLTLFAGLLILLLAAQFWLGLLLAFHGSEGSLFHFASFVLTAYV